MKTNYDDNKLLSIFDIIDDFNYSMVIFQIKLFLVIMLAIGIVIKLYIPITHRYKPAVFNLLL